MTTPEVVPADPGALADRLRRHPERRRLVIGICGAPGSGKSRLAGLIADQLNSALPGLAVVVPMDGFHLAASVIAADDRRTRRGAPDTFDPEGYAVLLQRLRENAESIAFYRGEAQERAQLNQRFDAAFSNFARLIKTQRSLNLFQRTFSQLTLVVPSVVLAGAVLYRERLSGPHKLATALAAAGVGAELLRAGGVSWETWLVAVGYPLYFALRRRLPA